MTVFEIAVFGAGIGVTAGIVGAGPSILTVLLLEHATELGIAGAITTSLVVVALMSLVALVPYALAGAVLWRDALGFGLASMTGAYLGGRVSGLVPARALLVIFLLAMVVAAVALSETASKRHSRATRRSSLVFILVGVANLSRVSRRPGAASGADCAGSDPALDCVIIDGGHVRARDLALVLPDSPLEAIMSTEPSPSAFIVCVVPVG